MTAGKEQIMRIIYVILDGAANAIDFTRDTAKNVSDKLSWWFDASNRYNLGLFIGYLLQFLAGFAIGYVVISVIRAALIILSMS